LDILSLDIIFAFCCCVGDWCWLVGTRELGLLGLGLGLGVLPAPSCSLLCGLFIKLEVLYVVGFLDEPSYPEFRGLFNSNKGHLPNAICQFGKP
jgi:hypothetical protein